MNADLARWMLARPFGFLKGAELAELVKMHRLCLCLVRLGGPGGRFMAPAQDVATLIDYCTKAGDYVRDVSIHTAELSLARAIATASADQPRQAMHKAAALGAMVGPNPGAFGAFDESQCGGAFDGNQVTSDADPGL